MLSNGWPWLRARSNWIPQQATGDKFIFCQFLSKSSHDSSKPQCFNLEISLAFNIRQSLRQVGIELACSSLAVALQSSWALLLLTWSYCGLATAVWRQGCTFCLFPGGLELCFEKPKRCTDGEAYSKTRQKAKLLKEIFFLLSNLCSVFCQGTGFWLQMTNPQMLSFGRQIWNPPMAFTGVRSRRGCVYKLESFKWQKQA